MVLNVNSETPEMWFPGMLSLVAVTRARCLQVTVVKMSLPQSVSACPS